MIRKVAIALLLSGCAQAPVKDAYVSWNSGCTGGVPNVVRVRFHDTPAPTIDCVRYMSGPQVAMMIIFGAPVFGCMVSYSDRAEIFATITPSVPQMIAFVGTLQTPEQILQHELRMAFGYEEVLPLGWADRCRPNS